MQSSRFVYRSSITGRWVKKSYADKHPDITERQRAGFATVLAHRIATATKAKS